MINLLKASIPSTGETLPRIGLGTYQAFDKSSRNLDCLEALNEFYQLGGTLVDSSPMYGKAEQVIGELSTKLNINEKLFMATKVWTTGEKEGQREIESSFRKLNRKYVELFQIHNLVDWRTQFKTLRKLKAEGLIKYIGITHYTTTAFSSLAEVIESEKGIDFLQIPYSIVELTGEERLIPKAASKGVAVIANEPFGNGQLFRLTKNKNLPSWCQEIGITSWSQFFLKFILSNPDVQFVIPGSSNKDHVRDNMLAGTGVLPSLKQREEMKKIF